MISQPKTVDPLPERTKIAIDPAYKKEKISIDPAYEKKEEKVMMKPAVMPKEKEMIVGGPGTYPKPSVDPVQKKEEPVMMMKGGVPNPSVTSKGTAVKVNEKGAKEVTI